MTVDDPVVENTEWWAFQPIQRPAVPTEVTAPGSQKSEETARASDRCYGAAAVVQKGLAQARRPSRASLYGDSYFDLIGLPPTPEEVASFERECAAETVDVAYDGGGPVAGNPRTMGNAGRGTGLMS